MLSAASVLFHNTGILMTIVILVMNYLRPSKKVAYSLLSGIFVISLFFNSVGLNLFSQLLASLNSLTAARYDYYSSSESYDLSERSVLSIGLNLILPYIFVYLSSDEELQKNIFLKTYILAPCVFLLFGSFDRISLGGVYTKCYNICLDATLAFLQDFCLSFLCHLLWILHLLHL